MDIGLLEGAFRSTPLNTEMMALARRLKPEYLLGIVTDNKQDRLDCLRKLHNLDSLFDAIVVSSEVGSNKENVAIFNHALNCLNVRPEEAIFIDNNRDNLIAPQSLGIHTVHHDDETNDVASLISTLKERFHLSLE